MGESDRKWAIDNSNVESIPISNSNGTRQISKVEPVTGSFLGHEAEFERGSERWGWGWPWESKPVVGYRRVADWPFGPVHDGHRGWGSCADLAAEE